MLLAHSFTLEREMWKSERQTEVRHLLSCLGSAPKCTQRYGVMNTLLSKCKSLTLILVSDATVGSLMPALKYIY